MKRLFGVMVIAALLMSALALCGMPALADCGHNDWYFVSRTEATCEHGGETLFQCGVCGEYMTERTSALGHNFGSWKVVKEPTCSEEGREQSKCSRCGETKSRSISKTAHSFGTWKVVKEPTCSEEGREQSKCTRCGETKTRSINPKGHSFGSWKITREATDSAMGERTSTCAVCGSTQTDSYYPDGTLYRGIDSRESVAKMQQELIDIGLLNDVADGLFGRKTEQAVLDYQAQQGFEQTGIAFPQTLKSLSADWGYAIRAAAAQVSGTPLEGEPAAIDYTAAEGDFDGEWRCTGVILRDTAYLPQELGIDMHLEINGASVLLQNDGIAETAQVTGEIVAGTLAMRVEGDSGLNEYTVNLRQDGSLTASLPVTDEHDMLFLLTRE